MNKILIIDDNAEFRSHITEVLNEEGFETDSAPSAVEALAMKRERDFDIVLLDFMMPGINGIDALNEIRKKYSRAKVIMVTAFATVENAVDVIKRGASDYICKPFKICDLLMTIRRVLEEAKFEECVEKKDFNQALSSIASPIRRNILRLLKAKGRMRLMEITRELGIDDHTKVVFHLRLLKDAGNICQNEEKSYTVTAEGQKVLECLKTMEDMLLN